MFVMAVPQLNRGNILKKVYAKHLPYKNGHYAKVYKEMELNDDGPIIRALKMGDDEYCAVEGSHRIASTHSQNKIPRLVILEPDVVGVPDYWWEAVKDTLPCYEFDFVFVMNEKDFVE